MHGQSLKGNLLIIALLGISLGMFIATVVSPVLKVKAQQVPFLISPYYGTENINSFFDHEYPTYYLVPNGNGNPGSENNIFTRYDGARWTNPPDPVDKNNCTTGVNCYDGHDGYDFSLVYERVLAAADGEIIQAGWQFPNDRHRSYGLRVEIRHANGYITRYGHLSSIAVSVGQEVTAGQVIATSGNTGNSTGAHLHFGVMEPTNARTVDPFGWSGGYGDPWAQYGNGAVSWCMWADGQWANVCGGVSRPIPVPADSEEIIIDDTSDNSGGFSKGRGGPFSNPCPPNSCPYWWSAAAGYGNDMWWTYDNDNVVDYWARWTPTIPQQGIYEVWVHVPNINATTWQAQYTISHYDGQSTAIVDQYGLSNQWVSIGVHRFHAGTSDSVHVTDATGEVSVLRQVGVDAVKFVRRAPTYLPDVRVNSSNWNSKIVVRSNGGSAFVDVKFYNPIGALQATQTNTNLAGHGVWEVPLPGLSNFSGSVVVDASQDVAVVAENLQSGEATNYQGITPSTGNGNAGWGQAGTTIYAPSVKYQLYGRTGRLYIFNAGTSTAHVSPAFYAWDSSASYSCGQLDIAPQGRSLFPPSYLSCPGLQTGQLYGVKLASDQPLAVVVVEQNDSGAALTATSNAFSAGSPTNYAPLVKSDFPSNNPNSTGITVQNVGTGNTTAQVTYYDSDSSNTWSDSATINSLSAHVFWAPNQVPADQVASARISASPAQNLVTTVYETKPSGGWRMQHNAFLSGSTTVILPRIYKNYGSLNWRTGIQVQNVSGAPANVTVRYYDQNGNLDPDADDTATSIQPNKSVTFYQPSNSKLDSPFIGSAYITSDQPIVAVVNVASDGTNDAAMSYSGFNR